MLSTNSSLPRASGGSTRAQLAAVPTRLRSRPPATSSAIDGFSLWPITPRPSEAASWQIPTFRIRFSGSLSSRQQVMLTPAGLVARDPFEVKTGMGEPENHETNAIVDQVAEIVARTLMARGIRLREP